MKIKALKTFLFLAKNNCDFGVHKILGLPRATMWAHITEIENETSLKLINRRKQNNTLTEEGLAFIPYAQKLCKVYEEGVTEIRDSLGKNHHYEGDIIISTTQAVSSTWLMPSIKDFHARYPCLRVNIVADDYLNKNLENTADIFVRPVGENLNVERKWHITYSHGLFASREYIEKHGLPKKAHDLKDHCVMGYGEHEFSFFDSINWHLKGKGYEIPKIVPTLTVNSTSALFKAACEGIGICSAPIESNTIFEEKLVRVLPEIKGPTVKTYFCMRAGISPSKRKNMEIFNVF